MNTAELTKLKLRRSKLSLLVNDAFNTPNPSKQLMAAALTGEQQIKALTGQINAITDHEARHA